MIEGWVQLEGSDKEQKITLDIPELKVKKEVTTDANGYASFLIKANLYSGPRRIRNYMP